MSKKSNDKNSKNNNKTEEQESKLRESFFPKLASKTAPDNDDSDETDNKEKEREQMQSSIDAILKKSPMPHKSKKRVPRKKKTLHKGKSRKIEIKSDLRMTSKKN
ncbi:hypothetical protein CEXT_814811 [Caerostris extrusa]|uniref:Uncharacterized protein n=1 Tax=Caerostris extrusa TaxID=172846 RepID=A0AAV4VKS0_CAEEX|nr:hypothetical protein CEXT_814811 [Caerostris extrusa]